MKKILAVLLVLCLLVSFVGCGKSKKNDDTPIGNGETKSGSNETMTAEETLWKYLEAISKGNFLEAAKYSCFDVEEIYEELIIKECRSLGISKQELYADIQERLDNSNINDYESFMKAAEDYIKKNLQDNIYFNDMVDFYKNSYKTSDANGYELKEFMEIYGNQSTIEELYIDLTKYVSFDSTTQYKKIYVPEDKMEEFVVTVAGMSQKSPNNEAEVKNLNEATPVPSTINYEAIIVVLFRNTCTRFLKETSDGWKTTGTEVLTPLLVIIDN